MIYIQSVILSPLSLFLILLLVKFILPQLHQIVLNIYCNSIFSRITLFSLFILHFISINLLFISIILQFYFYF